MKKKDLDNITKDYLLFSYQQQHELGNRIDNKIYIGLTICGALLAFIASTTDFSLIFSNDDKLYLIISISICCILGAIIFLSIFLIFNLISALKAHLYASINITKINCNDVHESDKYISESIIKVVNRNFEINDKRLDKVNFCFQLIKLLFVLSILYFLLFIFISI